MRVAAGYSNTTAMTATIGTRSCVAVRPPGARCGQPALDPGDSDEAGPSRRISMSTYKDYDDFTLRFPTYIADITRELEGRIQ
jgi:hypothetical protein